MNKNFIPIAALIIAILTFSFGSTKSKTIGCNPNVSYAWYFVSAALPCSNPGDINPTLLNITGHTAYTTDPLVDLTAEGWVTTETNFSEAIFVCASGLQLLCAVGFNTSNVTAANFEQIIDPSSSSGYSWRPKAASVVNVACYICRKYP